MGNNLCGDCLKDSKTAAHQNGNNFEKVAFQLVRRNKPRPIVEERKKRTKEWNHNELKFEMSEIDFSFDTSKDSGFHEKDNVSSNVERTTSGTNRYKVSGEYLLKHKG